MLKWLRKYNNIILVVGGVLLMVAWLLPETINQLGKQPFGSSPMKINGSKISVEEYVRAQREYAALNEIFIRAVPYLGGGESADHWLALSREAQRAGFVGGKNNAPDYINLLAREIVQLRFRQMGFQLPEEQMAAQSRQLADQFMNSGVPRAMGEAHMSEDDIFRAIGKLRGVLRMRQALYIAPRFSERRLASTLKQTSDAATLDYVFIPPERESAAIPDPDAAALQAHFDTYKTVKPGEGEYGIGYLLPDRVKLATMHVDREAVQRAVTPDPLEVRKRFLKAYPTGQLPAGQSESTVMSGLETTVRTEQTDQVMKAIDVAAKAEFEKLTRKLDTEGSYKKLPADWARPDFEKLARTIADRVREATHAPIPAPTVDIKAASYLTAAEVAALPGVGQATVQSGNRNEPLADLVFKVRELAGPNEAALQVGVPWFDSLTDAAGGRYYLMVLDARKESAPDSLDEIRDKVVTDYKNIEAFKRLRDRLPAFRELSIAQGLDALTKSGLPDGKGDATIKSAVRVDGTSVANNDQSVNHDEFRKAVLEVARTLDPLTDITKLDPAQRTVSVAIPKSQGVAVGRISAVSPVTVEQFRLRENYAAGTLLHNGFASAEDDPFSWAKMKERLKIERTTGRDEEEKAAAKKKA